MRIFTLFAVLFFSIQAMAQDQPGYYITSDGQRTEGFFKTSNFYDATTLDFRKADEAEFTRLITDNILEYGINGQFRFRKFSVDNSALFLNVVIEGNATLYSYSNKNIIYYYTVSGKQEQPVKLEVVEARGKQARKAENNKFREQLKQDVSCPNNTINFDRLQYKESDLDEVFTQYNQCTGATQVTYKNSTAKVTPVYFTLVAGLHNMNYNIDNMSTPYEDSNTLSAGLGVEGAYRFGKTGLEGFARLEFEHFSTSIKKNFPQPTGGYEINYFDINTTVVDLFVGPRYNFVLNDNNKLFIDASFGVSVPFGDMSESTELVEGTNVTLLSREKHDLDTAVCGNFGIGYAYSNKYGIAIRYETNREFFNNDNTGYTGQFSRIGVNLRYTFN